MFDKINGFFFGLSFAISTVLFFEKLIGGFGFSWWAVPFPVLLMASFNYLLSAKAFKTMIEISRNRNYPKV